MATILEQADLLLPLYDGPFETPMWHNFLDRLRRQTASGRATLTLRRHDAPPDVAIHFRSGAMGPDPLPADTMRPDRVYSLAELAAFGAVESGDARMVRVAEPGGLNAWLTIARGGDARQATYSPADGALLSRLAPHLSRVLRLHAQIERERGRSRLVADVMRRLDFGWIALDAKGQVIDESEEAAALLRLGAGLRRVPGGRLVAHDPAVERQLSAAIRSLVVGDRQPRAIQACAEPWVSLLLVPATAGRPGVTASTAIIIYLQGDKRSPVARAEQIADLFGLSPSEARLALALSRGLSIAEAADALGLTVETARNYSKKLYAKTGARGQADLVRHILTSVLALA